MSRLAYALVAVAVVAAGACSGGGAEQESPKEALNRVAPARRAAALPVGTPPGSYRIEFDRFTAASPERDGDRLEPEHLVRTVRRPFEEDTADHGTRRLGFAKDTPAGVERAVALRPLSDEARPDVYPPSTKAATGDGRRVAGRSCRVYRYAANEYCIDSAGLVLASVHDGVADVATKVTVLGDAPSASEIAATLAQGVRDPNRGSVRPIAPDSSPPGRDDWALAAAPEGFAFVGRYAVVPLSGEVIDRNSRSILAGVADVYVRGADTVVVDRGGHLDTTEITDKDLGALADTQPVNLGALGDGQSGVGGAGPFGYREVRARPEKGRYVVVAGTLPLDQLTEIARSLQRSPGGELRYLDNL